MSKVYIVLLVCGCMFFSCKSTNVYGPGISTTDIRDGVSELERSELEATEVKRDLKEIERDIDEIVRDQAGSLEQIESVLQQIRKQPINSRTGKTAND